MTSQQAAELWQGFVGSQTTEEFMQVSRSLGRSTPEEAVSAYVADIPAMLDYHTTAQESAMIHEALLICIASN